MMKTAYCTLRNGTLRNETKWNLYFAKWKSVLCEMKICTLRNENLYFAKWKSVLCEMKFCTLRNENLYFAKWKSVISWRTFSFLYNHDRDTHFSILSRHRTASSWCLESADLKTWDRGQKENNFSELVTLFAANCSGEISTEHCAFSTTAFGSWWTGFALFCYAMITYIYTTPPTLRE